MTLRTLLIATLALTTVSAMAQKKSKKHKKTDTVTAATLVPAHKLSTPAGVDGKTFSYAIGVEQGESLARYLNMNEGVDSANMKYAIEGLQSNLPEAERKRIMALAAGLKIAETNRTRVLPTLNTQATGKRDTSYVDIDEFNRGLADVLTGKELPFSADSAQKIVEKQIEFRTNQYKQEQQEWLAANKRQPGVVTTKSGLQYKIIKKGAGVMPTDTSYVDVNYEGRLTDGTIFDSSYQRGKSTQFPLSGVIKGWQEALKLMPEGSEWEVYIPAELAYGERAQRTIPANSTLVFRVELLKANAPKK